MQVSEIMTKNPACCTPDSNLQEVSKMMVDNDCGCIPIVDSTKNNKPVGTITDRDITIRTVAAGKNPLEMKASDIMSTNVVTISTDSYIEDCANVMKENDIRRVLVVDGKGGCCGIVAQADVAEYGPNPNLIGNVVHDISGSTHTPVKSDSNKYSKEKSADGKSSFLSLGTVLPLAAGVAAGAAYKYFYGSNSNPEENKVEQPKMNMVDNITNSSVGVAKSSPLKENPECNSLKTSPVVENQTFSNKKETLPTPEKETPTLKEVGRSAKHS